MQSLSVRIVSNLLCAIFHSSLINNAELSNFAGKKTKEHKSHYKPSKKIQLCRLSVRRCKI